MPGAGAGRPALTGTYRLQLGPEFGFAAAAEATEYLARAGRVAPVPVPRAAGHPGLAPTATTSSTTPGWPTSWAGRPASPPLAAAAHEHGLGIVVDVVPNHMARADPGVAERAAVVGAARRPGLAVRRLVRRRLGRPGPRRSCCRCSGGGSASAWPPARSSWTRDGPEPVLRYFEHVLPGPGRHRGPRRCRSCWTGSTTGWRYWRVGRRGAELPPVLRRRHPGRGAGGGPGGLRRHPRAAAAAAGDGDIDGLRVDHPDGLADPRGYLARLPQASAGSLGGGGEDPRGRRGAAGGLGLCAGPPATTALQRVSAGCSSTPRGRAAGRRCTPALTGAPAEFEPVAEASKREVVTTALHRRGQRLVDLLTGDVSATTSCCATSPSAGCARRWSSCSWRCRSTAPTWCPASPPLRRRWSCSSTPRRRRWPGRRSGPTRSALLVDLALGRRGRGRAPGRVLRAVPADLRAGDGQGRRGHRVLPVVPARGAQRGRRGPGPVRLVGPTSCTPGRSGRRSDCPTGMTTLSTHDTKRSEDVRARLARADRGGRGVGRDDAALARTARPATATVTGPTPSWSCCCGRPWSGPGRSSRTGWSAT